jgi:hypothetical protein
VAVIRRFIPGNQTVRPHPTEVDCYHQVLSGVSPRVHLSTFGSDQRQSEPKSSQSIQLDESSARELIEILESAFPALRQRR